MANQMKRAVTSASNLGRRALCPGSAAAEAQYAEVASEWSAEGTLMHSLFMTGNRPYSLTAEQRETLDFADRMANEFIASVRDKFNIPEDEGNYREHEVPLIFSGKGGAELFPGHADFIITWPKHSVRVILDAKFGYLDVPDAAHNLQLAVYAVMRHQQSPTDAAAVAIVQPRNFGPRISTAIYTKDLMPAVAAEVERIFRESEKPDAPRVAGELQCHHCRSKTTCIEYREKFSQIETLVPRAIETCTNDELVRLHAAIKFAKKIDKEVSTEMVHRIGLDGLPGWSLKNNGAERKVTDPMGMWVAFREYFLGHDRFTPAEYDACREMSWGKLETLVQQVTGLGEKKAKELIERLSAPFVTKTEKAKSPKQDK